MRLLLDTHVLLWVLLDAPELSKAARRVLGSDNSTTYASVASLWEIAIKQSLGKLKLPGAAPVWLIPALERANLEVLPIAPGHAVKVHDLPLHHRDPFDRMLVAQAMSEGLTLITRDRRLADYGVEVVAS